MKSELDPSSTTNKISSNFVGTVTSDTMQNNAWGYSLDNTAFSSIPKKDNAVKIRNITTFPTAEELKTTVHFGAKVDIAIAHGNYSADILFTAVAHANPNPPKNLHTISNLQQMTSAICTDTTTPLKAATQPDLDGTHHGDPNYVPTKTLTDTRDNNTYTVSKLADGKCWMTQNLRIINKTITSADSDVTDNFTIPASALSGFSPEAVNSPKAYLDSNHGGYYNWYTATAGTGLSTMFNNGQNAPSSICPKGWRLPTGGNNGEFLDLYRHYSLVYAMTLAPLNFTLFGYVSGNIINGQLQEGFFWSSTVSDSNNAHGLYMNYSGREVHATSSNKKHSGDSVRCVAR